MHGLLITDTNCHLPKGVLSRSPIDRLSDTDNFADRLLSDWLYQCDALLAVGSKQPVESWQRVVEEQQAQFADQRLSAHLKQPFYARLFSSRQRYAALGVVVDVAADLLKQGCSLDSIRAQLELTETQVQHTLAIPAHSHWNKSGSSWLQRWRHNKAGVLQFEQDRIRRIAIKDRPIDALLELTNDLAPPQASFNLSYAGDPASLQTQPAFREWHQRIRDRGGRCWLSAMDDVSAQHCGAGALSLAWISAPARRETP